MANTFKNKVVMVTGAAGNLGRAVCGYFTQEGAKLVMVDSKMEYLQTAFAALGIAKARALLLTADLSKTKDAEMIVTRAARKFGHIDALVHTVGGFATGDPVHQLPDISQFEKMMVLNAQTTYVTLGRVARHMVDHKVSGAMVAVLARSGLKGAKGMAAYTASKAAAERIVQSMAEELKDHNVRVNGVMPSTIDTPANRKDMPNADPSKWVTPAQLANVIGFLCSDAASAITGESVAVYNKV
jgi:NAD(P)-dependent dehydrogenase (short-subunit alcohol dehydrogenase family)